MLQDMVLKIVFGSYI